MTGPLTVLPVRGLPEITPGDNLADLIAGAAELRDGDVVVVAQKVVSKAEGALVRLGPDEPSDDARRRIARELAVEIVADAPWALIVRTAAGLVCANAGIDASNVPEGTLSLLPEDADRSAAAIRDGLRAHGTRVAVIVADTFGRPWRLGQTDVAIGVAGLRPLRDERGTTDRQGRTMTVTEPAVADELAAAADLVRAKADGVPVVIIRGYTYDAVEDANARLLVRDAETDLFRRGGGMLAAALERQWPDGPMTGPTDDELAHARRVADDLEVVAAGPPARLAIGDAFAAGLAAAVLADAGLAVRWQAADGRVMLEVGRPPARR
jgi:coenzyme F420-0:L-glutamate ligase/coenzyme F420-1:gamma-L-glutamate ligase